MKISNFWTAFHDRLQALHGDQSGVAMTEYLVVFSLVTFTAAVSLLTTAAFVRGYRDFLVWWLAHPAV